MGVNLQLLGITAIPRLAKRSGIQIGFPEQRMLFGATPENFGKAIEDSGKILDTFFRVLHLMVGCVLQLGYRHGEIGIG